jgi:hypothetical protein
MPPLPSHPIYHPDKPLPPGESPDAGLWVVAYAPGKGFFWTPIAPVTPENGLPTTPPGVPTTPDQGLPGAQPGPDNTLPGSQPKPDQGLPPVTATPKK